MNVPAIAKKSFDELRKQSQFINIVHVVVKRLSLLLGSTRRAKLIHQMVDDFNEEVFSHPLVKQLSPCKVGCTGCCHTQVSVTADEADLLVLRINQGAKVFIDRLEQQAMVKNDPVAYYKLSFEDRKCIFLNEEGKCGVYEDRPSVCRTNAVLGDAAQCDTSVSVNPIRLIRTPKSDMVIYAAYVNAKSSGTLPNMISQRLGKLL